MMLKKFLPAIIACLGILLIGAGTWMLSPPVALIVVGALLLADGVISLIRS